MNAAGIARVRACFENAEVIPPIGHPVNNCGRPQGSSLGMLPQIAQLPQPSAPAPKVMNDQEDAFEERAAIIEYDGGLPRLLAEFQAGRIRW